MIFTLALTIYWNTLYLDTSYWTCLFVCFFLYSEICDGLISPKEIGQPRFSDNADNLYYITSYLLIILPD